MLRLTGDDEITDLFVDGLRRDVIKTETLANWKEETEIPIDSKPRLIAIKANNEITSAAILASLSNHVGEDIAVSNSSWRCSKVLENGWETVEFREHSENWSNAVEFAKHGEGVWGEYSTSRFVSLRA